MLIFSSFCFVRIIIKFKLTEELIMELKPEQRFQVTNLDFTALQNIIDSMNAHTVDEAKKVAFQQIMDTYDAEVILQHILQAKIINFPPDFLTAIQFRILGKYDNRQQTSEKITALLKSHVHTSVIANLLLAKSIHADVKNDDDEKIMLQHYVAAAKAGNAETCYRLAIYQVVAETNPYSNIPAGIQNLKTASQCGHQQAIQCLKQLPVYLQMHTEQQIEAIKKQQEEQRLKEQAEAAQNPTISTTTAAVHKKRTRDDMDTDDETQHEPKEQKLESTTQLSTLTYVLGNEQTPMQTAGTMQSDNVNITTAALNDAVTTISIEEPSIQVIAHGTDVLLPYSYIKNVAGYLIHENMTNPGANPHAHFGATATLANAEVKEYWETEVRVPQSTWSQINNQQPK